MEEGYPKQVENNVGKGEIACYEQFFLFPQCFQKICFAEEVKGVIVWEWVKSLPCKQQKFRLQKKGEKYKQEIKMYFKLWN